ncbi:hypothetical protein KC921_00205 [Candidatus Woesebacteria bacterium]|nr:hypothetical protein [Candidatus Woesebacteria bacterium]
MSLNTALLLYLPVWHAGYQQLFDANLSQLDHVLIVDPIWAQTLAPTLDYLRKDIRALTALEAKNIVSGLYPKLNVQILDQNSAITLKNLELDAFLAPDDDVSHQVAESLGLKNVEFLPVFLRWDRTRAVAEHVVTADEESSADDFAKKMLGKAYDEAEHSSDWWRHVGAILTRKDQVLFAAANRHQPSDQTPYIVGDVRQLFKQGEYMNYSTAEHAECAVIAEAARRGVSTENTQLYVTTFPCPYCARLITHAGISEVFFAEGYATLDGEELLKQAGIKITKVVVTNDATQRSISVPYPEK